MMNNTGIFHYSFVYKVSVKSVIFNNFSFNYFYNFSYILNVYYGYVHIINNNIAIFQSRTI